MKKYLAALFTALLLLCTALSAGAVGPALTTTEAYCIIDADTGLVLAQQNMNEELHPASITKVMTLGLACQKAQGNWDGVKLTVSHEDVYSLAGTDSSHIALREGEEVPLQDALYGTMIASANDGANLLAEYFGGGTIEGGVAAMNAQVQALGLEHTHFANPHGISGDDHYTSCYDMAQILRWALTQPGFETIFTRLEMYTMAPTNVQPVTRYFSQQDKMRLSYSRYYIPAIRGSKIGYTSITRITHSVAQAAAAVQASEMAMSIPAVLAGLTSEAVSSSLPAFASSSASSPVSTAGTRALVDSCLSPPLTVYTAYTSGEVPRTYRSGSSSDTETSPAVTPSASSSRTPGSVTVTLPSVPPPPTTSTSPVRPWEGRSV